MSDNGHSNSEVTAAATVTPAGSSCFSSYHMWRLSRCSTRKHCFRAMWTCNVLQTMCRSGLLPNRRLLYLPLSIWLLAIHYTFSTPAQSYFITARCTLVQSAVLRSHVVCLSVRLSVHPSVTLVDQDHIGWKSWKLIARTLSPTPSLFVAQRPSTYSQGNMGKLWGD